MIRIILLLTVLSFSLSCRNIKKATSKTESKTESITTSEGSEKTTTNEGSRELEKIESIRLNNEEFVLEIDPEGIFEFIIGEPSEEGKPGKTTFKGKASKLKFTKKDSTASTSTIEKSNIDTLNIVTSKDSLNSAKFIEEELDEDERTKKSLPLWYFIIGLLILIAMAWGGYHVVKKKLWMLK